MRRLVLGVATGVLALGITVTVVVALPDRPSAPARAAVVRPVRSEVPLSDLYAGAVDDAHADGLRVWLEADLVKRWLAGRAAFQAGVARLAALSTHPGVVGFKIADEMGYHDGLDTSTKIQRFLNDSATALRAAAPGKLILIDLLVPELGCMPDYLPPLRWATVCDVQQRGLYPQLTLDRVDGYLRSGAVDVVDLSTGLQPDVTYAGWGVDADTAQRAAWQEVQRRGWSQWVRLQARKALAHPGRYPGTTATARASLRTYVDIPTAMGATAVDVWTWRQLYQGQIYRLPDPGPRSNPLWAALVAEHARGLALFTHFSPRSVEGGVQPDLRMISTVCTDVFVAAGTG